MTESFLNSTGTKTMTGAINIVKAMVNTMKPIFGKKTGQNFTDAISKSLNLTPKLTSEEKRKQNKEKLQNSHEKLKTTLSQDDFDVNYFLSSGKSYSQYERDIYRLGNHTANMRRQTGCWVYFKRRECSCTKEKSKCEKQETSWPFSIIPH